MATKVPASSGAPYIISRLPDGSVNVQRKSSTISFRTKQDVAACFAQLYSELYPDQKEHTSQ